MDVSGIADAPSLEGVDVAGIEDTAIPLNIGIEFVDSDGSESLSVTIGGVPEGATLNIGGVAPGADGTITVDATPAQIAEISMTPPENFSGDILLNVVATTSEDGTEANTLAELSVHVTGDADAPIVAVSDALGAEDSAIPLEIVPLLVDTDGSEIITNVTVSGVPEGAELSAGTDNADGTWTLLTSDLVGITVTPPPNASGEFSLAVSVTTTEADGDSATTTSTLNVSVDAAADGPRITGRSGRSWVGRCQCSRHSFCFLGRF